MRILGTFNSVAHEGVSGIITIDLSTDIIYIEYAAGSKYRPGYVFSYPVSHRMDSSADEKTITLGSDLSSGPMMSAYITIRRGSSGLKVNGKYSMIRPVDSGSIQISPGLDTIYELWKDIDLEYNRANECSGRG